MGKRKRHSNNTQVRLCYTDGDEADDWQLMREKLILRCEELQHRPNGPARAIAKRTYLAGSTDSCKIEAIRITSLANGDLNKPTKFYNQLASTFKEKER